jgi:quercetin dioxygenase-like cupin family protein
MAKPDPAKAPGYKVKCIEPVVKSTDVQARVFTLAPGDRIPWHYHRHSTDHYFVLEGVLSISTREPDLKVRSFPVGSRYKTGPGTPHLVANDSDADCRFLLLQGVGQYDFNPID